ncbi:hypothetical protein L4D76_11015 [Photobacterium sagamiensis]|uniref:hypothetical protein n=1 Tax=Photobacterium sagamiensis TaxID=2910241 RepID=UPI003D0B0D40
MPALLFVRFGIVFVGFITANMELASGYATKTSTIVGEQRVGRYNRSTLLSNTWVAP